MDKNSEFHTVESSLLSFDVIVLVRDVLKRWLLVLTVALMVGVGAYVATDLSYEPSYTASTTFVVTSRSSSSTVYKNLTATNGLASVFSELMNSSLMRSTVLTDAGLGDFSGSITASVIPETNLLTLRVTDSNPRTAYLVNRAIVEGHEALTYEVVGDITLEVLQSPTVPTAPSNYPNADGAMKRAMILTAAVMCVGLAYLSYSRDTVRSGMEARRKLDCRYLGEIAHERKYKTLRSWLRHQKTGVLITNPITSFRFGETIRKLRHRIERHMSGKKVLMVTSLLENEGKSTVAANIALSLARKYKRVLFLECDLRKPAGCTILEKTWTGPGVRDVLIGKATAEEAVVHDKNTGLYMLLDPKSIRNPAELMGSEAMQNLINWTREHFDYVVLDLPPMAAAMDAESIMDFADASLLVVRQNTANAKELSKAISTLENGKADLIGCVLNNTYSSGLSGQGYGYGYGRYNNYGNYGGYGGNRNRE